MNADIKSSCFTCLPTSTPKAKNILRSLIDAVGEKISSPSVFCRSPLAHNLAFNLSSPPKEFILALNININGMICSPGRGWPSRLKVCSTIDLSSLLMASIHCALVLESVIFKICLIDFGSGIKGVMSINSWVDAA